LSNQSAKRIRRRCIVATLILSTANSKLKQIVGEQKMAKKKLERGKKFRIEYYNNNQRIKI